MAVRFPGFLYSSSIVRSSSSSAAAAAAAAGRTCIATQRCCVGRHLANKNELRVSGSDSYASLFLL